MNNDKKNQILNSTNLVKKQNLIDIQNQIEAIMIDIKPGVIDYWFTKFNKVQIKSYIKRQKELHELELENQNKEITKSFNVNLLKTMNKLQNR